MKRIPVLLIASIFIFLLSACGKDTARTIAVEELNGTTHVTNQSGTMDVYVGQHLISGDDVNVETDSNMTLLIDMDKHLFADAGTHFSLEATGSKGNTQTKINLFEGSVLSGIDNKLKDSETYEVSTPNATMAVRGTVFDVVYDNFGITTVEVMDGEVDVIYHSPDGEETILLKTDEKAVISGVDGEVIVNLISADESIGEDIAETPTNVSSDGLDHYASEEEFFARIASRDYGDEEMFVRKGRICKFSEMYKEQFDEWATQRKSYSWRDYIIVLDEPIEYNGKQYDKVLCNGRILNDLNEFNEMMGHYLYLYGFVSMMDNPTGENSDFDAVIELWGEYPPDYCVQDYIYLD